MGVPNFYSWLIRRYPLCLYPHTTIQQVDFLYLDMNQIIYKCATDARILFKDQLLDRHFEEVWVSIINYLDLIISVANPQQLVFLAFDGVAPRAKMNQQRQRRFQSQKRYKNLSRCLESIGLKNTNQTYKNNQFSPGTEFMNDLNKQIKFYIEKKYQEDPKFRKLKCIFSGIDVPGEGEHKLLSYIRNIQSKCNPNSVHMIYGADADLIMLGLLTQLKNVLIFREEMKLSREASAAANRVLHSPNFLIINISMIRECLDLEFKELQQEMKIPYSIDRIIDDFILLCFFVGNDFLPRVYCFDIRIGTIEPLLDLFKRHLTHAQEYIVNRGDINFVELLNLLGELKQFEKLCINDRQHEMDKFLSNKKIENVEKEKQVIDTILNYFKNQEETEGRKFYYDKKCEIIKDKEIQYEILQKMCSNYIEGIQFVLCYYYKGVPSWEWYYEFYYAPLCEDIYGMVQMLVDHIQNNNVQCPIQFNQGEPYPPFKQLLSILTPDNAQLLPQQYGKLLTDQNSILRHPIDYYPDQFETDSYGTMYDHQHITKIPFLDCKIIDKAYDSIEHIDDVKNKLGQSLYYVYNENQNQEYESTLPQLFKNFKSHSQKKSINLDNQEDCIQTIENLIKDEGNQIPTLKILQIKNSKLIDIQSRDEEQKFENQSLQIEIQSQQFDFDQYIKELIENKYFIYCDFPILKYCQVYAILRIDNLYILPNIKLENIKLLDQYSKKNHQKFYVEQQNQLTQKYEKLGLKIKPQIMMIVKRYKYLIRNNDNQIDYPEKVYEELIYPFELTYLQQEIKFIKPNHEDFQIDRKVVVFHRKQFNGAVGLIKQIDKDLQVEFIKLHQQSSFEYIQNDIYYSLQFVSEKLGCNVNTVLNLLGSVVVQMEDNDSKIADALDIGLNIINRSQSQLVPELVRLNQADQYAKGYSKYQQFKDLELSEKCVTMLCEYRNQCPRIQQYLNNIKENLKSLTIKSSDLFKTPDPNIELLKLYIWILKLPESQYLLQGISSKVAILKINKKTVQFQEKNLKKINPGFAIQESLTTTYLPPFFIKHPSIHKIGDRVVNLKHPFGIYGTVVGLLDKDEILVQVLWDEKFIGFSNLGGRYDLLSCTTCKFTDIFNLSKEDWISCLAQRGQYKGEYWDLYTKNYVPTFKSKPIEENQKLTDKNPFQQLKELPQESKPKVLVKEKQQQQDVFQQLLQNNTDKITTVPLSGISEQEIIKEQQAQQKLQEIFQLESLKQEIIQDQSIEQQQQQIIMVTQLEQQVNNQIDNNNKQQVLMVTQLEQQVNNQIENNNKQQEVQKQQEQQIIIEQQQKQIIIEQQQKQPIKQENKPKKVLQKKKD